ncbi:Tryptophan halogenase [Burkholderia sp. 8Y]|uniref:NAD(P)/FAD-dependent oxidoreductase n=1 Tax=Burkholderia sp. 8Y TaxID=2653133 RepID=UPI0012F11B2F|nr:FAD-dependent monooxygenase [Burkholderia sp. 8Y]VXC67361.1 Tryptophan halogenase [Burkholderia sp. 8Y]
MQITFDAVIIGAGPAGSTAAILLALAGWSVALVEKQGFPRRKVCGECVAPATLSLLAALGIERQLTLRAGPDLVRVALMQGTRKVVADLPEAQNSTYRWGRAIGRETLDTVLVEQARKVGVEVLQPYSVTELVGGPGSWRCAIRRQGESSITTLSSPVMIAAHGSWGALALASLQNRREQRPADLFAFKANFHEALLEPGLLPVFCFEGGYGGMVDVGGGVTTVAGCLRRDRLEALRREHIGASAGDCFEAMLRSECAGVKDVLRQASKEGSWIGAGPIDPGIRLRADDGLFRVGNAAGEVHPIVGEGISMAVQSAWLLCIELLRAKASQASSGQDVSWQRVAARRYAREWRHQFLPRMRLAFAFAHACMRPRSSALLLALASLWPGLLSEGARWVGKTRCAIDPGAVAWVGAATLAQ